MRRVTHHYRGDREDGRWGRGRCESGTRAPLNRLTRIIDTVTQTAAPASDVRGEHYRRIGRWRVETGEERKPAG